MKCFYHNDADGRCSAFLVKNYTEPIDGYPNREFIEMSYGKPFPLETILENEQIYIVDYSISPDEMRRLFDITRNVIWIDHHKTAIEKYQDFGHVVPGVRKDGVAACMLTWGYVCNGVVSDAPTFVRLIADWDIWEFEFGDTTRHFITAFNAYDFSPESKEWLRFTSGPNGEAERTLAAEGRTMLKFRDGWARDYMKLGFETELEGFKCFAVNLGHCNSECFKSLPPFLYDILVPFVFDGDQFTVSLYSSGVDVSEIAKKYGGGGHKGAAGFQCKVLPFQKRGDSE